MEARPPKRLLSRLLVGTLVPTVAVVPFTPLQLEDDDHGVIGEAMAEEIILRLSQSSDGSPRTSVVRDFVVLESAPMRRRVRVW